jgi:hypothetical protein
MKFPLLQIMSAIILSIAMPSTAAESPAISGSELANIWPDHPGLIPELPAGTLLPNGLVAGEYEALLWIYKNEIDLYKQVIKLDRQQFRKKYFYEMSWFQRVGNYRKKQKCEAINKMQSDFKIVLTGANKCMAAILQ